MALIWDGEAFKTVDDAEADRLVKADMAQNLSARFTAGNELRRRGQFTGYANRMMSTGAPKVSAKPKPKPKAEKPAEETPVEPKVDRKLAVGQYLGKPAEDVTEDEVSRYYEKLVSKSAGE